VFCAFNISMVISRSRIQDTRNWNLLTGRGRNSDQLVSIGNSCDDQDANEFPIKCILRDVERDVPLLLTKTPGLQCRSIRARTIKLLIREGEERYSRCYREYRCCRNACGFICREPRAKQQPRRGNELASAGSVSVPFLLFFRRFPSGMSLATGIIGFSSDASTRHTRM